MIGDNNNGNTQESLRGSNNNDGGNRALLYAVAGAGGFILIVLAAAHSVLKRKTKKDGDNKSWWADPASDQGSLDDDGNVYVDGEDESQVSPPTSIRFPGTNTTIGDSPSVCGDVSVWSFPADAM